MAENRPKETIQELRQWLAQQFDPAAFYALSGTYDYLGQAAARNRRQAEALRCADNFIWLISNALDDERDEAEKAKQTVN